MVVKIPPNVKYMCIILSEKSLANDLVRNKIISDGAMHFIIRYNEYLFNICNNIHLDYVATKILIVPFPYFM